MKPLLNKTTRPFLIYVLVILSVSIPVYYLVIDEIWKTELDEHNRNIARKTAGAFNRLRLSDTELKNSIALWNRIQPETDIREMKGSLFNDIYTTIENHPGRQPERYRSLKTVIYLNKSPFVFTIRTNIEETEETMTIIGFTTAFFFIIIVLGLLVLNRRLSASIWKPFRNTLEKVKDFNLRHQQRLNFEKTDTLEFEELHKSLDQLITQSIKAFKSQKEFTENASHELQTPLAIIKQKLDLLMQNKDLTEDQYNIAEDISKALMRSTRINKNLLLLAKVDSSQFDKSADLRLSQLVEESLHLLGEYFEQKEIRVQSDIFPDVHTRGNTDLTEILINNLLVNTIRYTQAQGIVSVVLNESFLQLSNPGKESLDRNLLFKRFLGNSAQSGTGLGLAIVQQICTFQNWNIEYRFKNGNHVFTVSFQHII